jgi:membrane protein YqaA with SNARE-associated domain
MDQQSLTDFTKARISEGDSRTDVHDKLSAVGWTDDEIDRAYAEALIASGVPVPETARASYAKRSSAVEVVLNFFSFILLGVVATALGALYYGIINYFFPDPLDATNYWRASANADAIHYATAALIIGFPLYVAAVRLWFKKFREEEGKVEAKLTKWITHIILLVASVTVVGDLIAVVYSLLQGELTVRFFLKALTLLVIAGSIFGFYYLERKKIQYRRDIPRSTFKLFGWTFLGIIIVGILLGFVAAGSPATERSYRLDEQRADDLTQLASCVTRYAQQFERLPNTLDELETVSEFSYCARERDPESGGQYEYRVVEALASTGTQLEGSFELCATFDLQSRLAAEVVSPYARGGNKWYDHGAGRSCDTESVVVKPIARPAAPTL